jgi:hypothetical protein
MNDKWIIRAFVIFFAVIVCGLGVMVVFPDGLTPLGYAKIGGCFVVACLAMILFDMIVFE